MSDDNNGRDSWLTIQFAVLLLAGVGLFCVGLYLAYTERQFTVMALGWLAIAIPSSIYALMGRQGGEAAPPPGENTRQLRLLEQISERLLISDQAKRTTYRQKERDSLRQAIVEDIRTEDYAAAMALVNDMAELYGYREEAEQFRQQILETQAKKRQGMIRAAVDRIDQITQRHDWDLAQREVERLKRMYPDYPEVSQLGQRVREARDAYKNELLREFKEAHDREETDRAAELLLEMDKYLSPEEARPYTEMARDVLNRKKENMGVRFKMAVADHDWTGALNVGQQIIREFPNSHFAVEVREMLETLKERAAVQKPAPVEG